jgi:Cu/Ag efflux protein CusF
MEHDHDHAASQAAAPSKDSTPQTEGEIRKVDTAAQKLTVKHGRIENLGMSPMTMVFRVKDPAFLTIVELKRVP